MTRHEVVVYITHRANGTFTVEVESNTNDTRYDEFAGDPFASLALAEGYAQQLQARRDLDVWQVIHRQVPAQR